MLRDTKVQGGMMLEGLKLNQSTKTRMNNLFQDPYHIILETDKR